MFQRILVPLDGSVRAERALPIAIRLARASGGSVVLLRVADIPLEYEPALYASYVSETPFYAQDIQQAELAKARVYLADVAHSAQCAGITTQTEVLSGEPEPWEPAPAILTAAGKPGEEQVDLVVMCSHGRTGLKRWALGSVAQKVARQSPVPVLIVPPVIPGYEDGLIETRHPLRALVAVDGSALAEAALLPAAELVGALATPAQGILHLGQVVHLPTVASERPSWQSALQARERILHAATSALSTLADTTRAEVAAPLGVRVTWSLAVKEDVAAALIDMAELGKDTGGYEDQGFDLIALATHGRGGFQRWRLGSITERVLSATKLPVLVVRPHHHAIATGAMSMQGERSQ